MNVVFASNLPVLSESGTPTLITTDPLPVSPALTHLQLTINTHRAFALGTTPSFSMVVTVQGSNDGQTWYDSGSITEVTITGDGTSQTDGEFLFAFVRIQLNLTTTAGDWSSWMGDIHGSFKSS